MEMSELLGFRSTPTLGKYLGFPIKHSSYPQDFSFIIERMQSRLVGWKANLLSLASKFVLTQSVISTIPNYCMQCVALPPKILQNVDRISRNFLWGLSDNKRKLHLISWKKITKPKKDGGLGLQATKEKNMVLLAKLNWRFRKESDSLWAKVLSKKYCIRNRIPNHVFRSRICSTTWAAMKKGASVFMEGSNGL